MDLKDTAELMTSDDYKDRFKAEFWQLKHRLNKLNDMLKNELDFIPDTPFIWLKQQAFAMQAYLDALSVRCDYENIDVYETANAENEGKDNGATIVFDDTAKTRTENDDDSFTEAVGLGNNDTWRDWLINRFCNRK